MAVAAPALMFVATAATLVGTGVAAYGAIQQGKQASRAAQMQAQAQAQAHEANAAIVRQNAARTEKAAGQERSLAAEERIRAQREVAVMERAQRRRSGSRLSALAGSGFQLSGSSIDLLADAAYEDEQQRLFVLNEGEDRARARLAGASVESMTARDQEFQAREFERQAASERSVGAFTASAARRSGRAGAIGTVLTGVSSTSMTLSQSPTFRRSFY